MCVVIAAAALALVGCSGPSNGGWSLKSRSRVRPQDADANRAAALAGRSPVCGNYGITIDRNEHAHLNDVQSARDLNVFSYHNYTAAAFRGDCGEAALGTTAGEVQLIDLTTREITASLTTPEELGRVVLIEYLDDATPPALRVTYENGDIGQWERATP